MYVYILNLELICADSCCYQEVDCNLCTHLDLSHQYCQETSPSQENRGWLQFVWPSVARCWILSFLHFGDDSLLALLSLKMVFVVILFATHHLTA